jgi:ribose transport system substrate-binding protein
MGYDIMNGRTPKQTMVLLPTPAITKENVATYTGWVKN